MWSPSPARMERLRADLRAAAAKRPENVLRCSLAVLGALDLIVRKDRVPGRYHRQAFEATGCLARSTPTGSERIGVGGLDQSAGREGRAWRGRAPGQPACRRASAQLPSPLARPSVRPRGNARALGTRTANPSTPQPRRGAPARRTQPPRVRPPPGGLDLPSGDFSGRGIQRVDADLPPMHVKPSHDRPIPALSPASSSTSDQTAHGAAAVREQADRQRARTGPDAGRV
jgi:hypothetical protein